MQGVADLQEADDAVAFVEAEEEGALKIERCEQALFLAQVVARRILLEAARLRFVIEGAALSQIYMCQESVCK